MSAVSLRRFVGTALASLALVTAACGGDSDSTGPGPDPVAAGQRGVPGGELDLRPPLADALS